MQKRFLGDVGDYLKYGLLRVLTTPVPPRLRLAVVWYAVSSTAPRAEIRYKYLQDGELGECDPDLFLRLRKQEGRLDFGSIPHLGILPADTVYIADPVPAATRRAAWFDSVTTRLEGADLAFLDPDNGIAPKAKSSRHHVSIEEICKLAALKVSILVYHHLNRQHSHANQLSELLRTLSSIMGRRSVLLFWSRLGGGRAFVLLPHSCHKKILLRRTDALKQSGWGKLFKVISSGQLYEHTTQQFPTLPDIGDRRLEILP